MNRAEMITMFYRASIGLQYGTDCSQQSSHITDVTVVSSTKIRLTFDRDLSAARAEDAARYAISRPTAVQFASLIDSKTVELSLSDALVSGSSYTVTVSDLLAQDGTVFSDRTSFTYSAQAAHIIGSTAVSAKHVQLTFDTALDTARATDPSRYAVTSVSGGASLDVQSVTMLDSRKVDLTLVQSITSDASYDITTRNLLTQNGVLFTDSIRVKLTVPAGHITNATAQSTRRIRLAFDIDLDTIRASDVSHFSLARTSGAGAIGVQSITILNSKTIELFLAADITPNVSYLVTASHLLTQAGTDFSESANVMFSSALTGHVTSVTPVASNRIDVSFDVDLDTLRSEESTRYSLTDSAHTVPILSAQLLTNRTVELSFGEALQPQRFFTLDVRGMQTTTGVIFSDSTSFVYAVSSANFHANLTGGQEVPSVTTAASGTGSFVLMTDGLHYDISVQSLSGSIVSAHFHQAPSGQNGSAIFTIPFGASRATGVWSDITGEQRNLLFDGGIYVNVTTTARPNGEVRGQVLH